jgi:hypothetical protein
MPSKFFLILSVPPDSSGGTVEGRTVVVWRDDS